MVTTPVEEEHFHKIYGIEKRDLERLIDFCRDTGKVQFILHGDPKLFEGLDYLDPLFEELHSPVNFSIPLKYQIEQKKLDYYKAEFETLINLQSQTGTNYIQFLKSVGKNNRVHYSFERVLFENLNLYTFFREYGYNEIIENFEYLLLFDSEKAMYLLNNFGKIIFGPKQNSLKSDYIFSFESVAELRSCINRPYSIERNNIHEIGKFLLNKITFMPESFDACKDVISRYDQEDLYKVSASLHEGVIEANPDKVCKKNIELSEILDNVWSDAKLEKRIKGVNYGIPITTALIGTLAAGPVGGVGGFLSGLGVNVISEIIGVNQDNIAEKLVKKIVPNHIVNILNFKKKYNIEKQ